MPLPTLPDKVTPDDPHGEPGQPRTWTPNRNPAPTNDSASPSGELWQKTMPASQPAVSAPTASVGAGQEQASRQFMAGAGGNGAMYPAAAAFWAQRPREQAAPVAQAPAAAAPTPAAPAPSTDPQQFLQASGLQLQDPAQVQALMSGDTAARAETLRSLPPADRLKAIDALKKLGHQ